jgi:hypothetical protein
MAGIDNDEAVTADKPKRHSSWTLEKITAVIALCTVFFGVGTLADLSDRLFPHPTAAEVRGKALDAARRSYVTRADATCQAATDAVKAVPPAPDPVTYAWMTKILALRRQLAADWARLGPAGLDATDPDAAADVLKMLTDFRAATAFWAATADDLKAGDVAGYNANLGLFTSADGTFGNQTRRFGFRVCSYQWPTVPIGQ